MMFCLILDILADRWNIGFAHRKCAEACLPGKVLKFRRLRFDPFGRRTLEVAYCGRKRDRAMEEEKDMHMILHRIDDKGRAIHVFENRRHVGVAIGTQGIRDASFPIFGGKNEVYEIVGERLGHGRFLGCGKLERPFRALIMVHHIPRAMPWAGIDCPVGALHSMD